jgi:hypothetical protein
MTGFGVIVYGVQNSTLRSIVMLDTPEAPVVLEPGEAALHLGFLASVPSIEEAKAHIFSKTNVSPPSGRCCVVGNGIVIGTISADPAIDTHPQGTLVFSDHAERGDLYANGQFQRRYAVVQVGTGRVINIVYADPAAAHAANLIPSTTLNVGGIVPVHKGPPTGATS